MRNVLAVVAVALLVAVPACAGADEKPVKESEVPKAVLDAVKKKYPKAELKGFEREEEKGRVSYEVKLEVKEKERTRSIEVVLAEDGKILAEEEKIGEADLPDAVKKALAASKYAKWTVKKVEKVVKEEKEDAALYELVVQDGDKKVEVVFDKSGKIVEEEEKGKKEGKEEDDKD